ncbi:hypothetical protein CIL05_07155 [Virgibacillus profundi]|uniref:Uncharacterized protein n=1 Tax=Virgibacillus profundi TaxID=2024555 RepID=A0A2A2IFT4_9BACI|nr:hypothetical protein [Virgibacillus profundi]PAV30238.1 hypothetical protein CIL05_07155 [Virgibacillus profundi]PXY54410.1 hypothetical protein CIT14_07240 [Virgibacillus profundi]
MLTILDRDIEIVENILGDHSSLEVTHCYDDSRSVGDFKEALEEVLNSLTDKEEYIEEYKEEIADHQQDKKEMLKHIKRLEKMLNKREVKFKNWEAVEDDLNY